ncbi:MAG TPA: CHAT domain-containing tetratricopeptide repeat protein, partial [Isosphaeraceae bacterium]|nr:CHAT domain-containing tetratricopeptide repeat protein [Isosphaeraceae bacterium]
RRDPSVNRDRVALAESILQRLQHDQAPPFRAAVLVALGEAYRESPVGNRADNLQKAIACYDKALHFFTPEAAPFAYAATQTNLGNAFFQLPTGDRAANLRKAIACYEQVLRVLTPKAHYLECAKAQTNLGNAYVQLPTGDRAANLRKAIECYEQALRVFTPEAAPFEYAKAQANLGNAYCELPVGDRADNLRKAIACYEQALRFRTPEAAPFEYARTQHSLGNAYRELPVGDLAANLRKAITCCEQALRFLTPEAAPDGCRRAALGLGYLYFRESQWTQAQASYNTAIKATDALYKLAATEVSRQAELAEVRDLFSNLAFCLARRGKPNEAVEQLEAGKARGLAEALARDRAALDRVEAEDRKTFEEACSRIRSLEAEARAMGLAEGSEYTTSRSFAEISEDLRAARHDLYSVIDRIRAYQPEFMSPGLDFEAIVAAVATDCPLVYLITTSQGSLALIVPPGTKTLDTDHVVWLDELRSGELDGLLFERSAEGKAIGGYVVGQVLGEYQQLQAGLDRALPILSDRLVGPLAARLVELGFRRASLVPGGLLSLLPLHAAGFDAVTFIYTPSTRALQAARAAARERAKRAPMLLGIGNPLPNPRPLAFARTEVEEIAPRFAPEALRLLFERDATQAAVAKSLPGTSHLHFSCHGTFNVREPLDSALYLSGADTLTLRELLDGDLDLSAARLAVLSACQTGIVDFNKVPDEAIGFPAGFLQAGVPGVVSTLWPVSDISTAILMSRFYFEHLGNGLDPASALHRAQDWLRTATARDMSLADRYERRYQEGDGKALQLWRYYRDNPEVRPFAHPYYWAAFTFTGVA